MNKKKNPIVSEKVAKEAKAFLKDPTHERIAVTWRAILGLPKDFKILPIQITVCMAAAQSLIWPDDPAESP